jgi:hypothetical protein
LTDNTTAKKRQIDKPLSTKYYTENKRLTNTNFTKNPEVNSDPPERLAVPAPLVATVVYLFDLND